MWVNWISCYFLILYLCFMIIILSFYSCFLSFCVGNFFLRLSRRSINLIFKWMWSFCFRTQIMGKKNIVLSFWPWKKKDIIISISILNILSSHKARGCINFPCIVMPSWTNFIKSRLSLTRFYVIVVDLEKLLWYFSLSKWKLINNWW